MKLSSSLRTVAETNKFVGSLGPAYNVLKPLLSYFGWTNGFDSTASLRALPHRPLTCETNRSW
jgi:hypothetical protein